MIYEEREAKCEEMKIKKYREKIKQYRKEEKLKKITASVATFMSSNASIFLSRRGLIVWLICAIVIANGTRIKDGWLCVRYDVGCTDGGQQWRRSCTAVRRGRFHDYMTWPGTTNNADWRRWCVLATIGMVMVAVRRHFDGLARDRWHNYMLGRWRIRKCGRFVRIAAFEIVPQRQNITRFYRSAGCDFVMCEESPGNPTGWW